MNTKILKEINKKMHKRRKSTKTKGDGESFDRVLIRHWNIFLNNQRGRTLFVLEKKTNKKIYRTLLNEIAKESGVELIPIDSEYIDEKKSSECIAYYSPLLKYLKELLSEK